MTIKQRMEWLIGITATGLSWLRTTAPSAIRFPRVNADNTVSYLTDVQFRAAIGAGTGGGDISGNVGLVDNRLVRSSGSSGAEVSASSITVDDSGNFTTAGTVQNGGILLPPSDLNPGNTFSITNPTGDSIQIRDVTGTTLRVDIPDSGDIEFFDFVLVAGLESSDDISTSGVLQAGSGNTVAYSRLGTGTTSHALNGPEDILVSGDAEVNGTLYADGDAVVAGVATFGGAPGQINTISIGNAIIFEGNTVDAAEMALYALNPLVDRQAGLQDASGIIAYIPIVTPVTPVNGQTITSTTTKEDETHYITPTGTLATLTVTLPHALDSRQGQIIRVFISQIITALTVDVASGGVIEGALPDTSAPNSTFAYQCVDTAMPGRWIAITLQ